MSNLTRLEFKAAFTVDDTGQIEGLAWPFGSADRVGDEILPGAFAKAVGPLPMLAFHDQSETVGVWDSVTETAQGLVVKGRLLIEHVARAKEILALVKERALPALSIGFAARKAAPRRGGGRTISALDLLEISIVAIGAHPGARITSAKAAGQEEDNMTTENTAIDIKALETLETKLTARLDAIEAKGNRLAADNDNDEVVFDTKAISDWAKTGQLDGVDTKTLVVGTPSAGGYTVAPEYRSDIIKSITELNPIRQLAGVTSTGTNKIYWPVLASDPASAWVTEVAARDPSEPTFSQVAIDIFEHGTIVPISRQLLEDSVVDMSGLLAERIAQAFARTESEAFLTGSGTGEPSGILDALANIDGENDTADVLDDIVDAFYALPSAYAARGSWLMSRPTIAKIRKAADLSDNRNGIWSDSLAVGTPARLLGAPVYEAPGLDTHGATATGAAGASVIFGDVASAFRIVDRVGLEILRDDFTGAANGIVRFHARKRVGSAVVLPEALVAIKTA